MPCASAGSYDHSSESDVADTRNNGNSSCHDVTLPNVPYMAAVDTGTKDFVVVKGAFNQELPIHLVVRRKLLSREGGYAHRTFGFCGNAQWRAHRYRSSWSSWMEVKDERRVRVTIVRQWQTPIESRSSGL